MINLHGQQKTAARPEATLINPANGKTLLAKTFGHVGGAQNKIIQVLRCAFIQLRPSVNFDRSGGFSKRTTTLVTIDNNLLRQVFCLLRRCGNNLLANCKLGACSDQRDRQKIMSFENH